ncbi:hypothetical protein DMA11_04000 [Marinilabiliaceae bacterium JC017]|nr:hypothetical protein DMA11_04000 [Marinilabiliaceae bacterium JC017]
MKKLFLFISIYFCITSYVHSQTDSINIKLATFGVVADSDLQPLWNYSNQWGLFDAYEKSEGLLYGKGTYQIFKKRNFNLEMGVAGVVKNDLSKSFLHEGYLKGNAWWIDFSMGIEAYSSLSYNSHLSSGAFISGMNARPVPKISMGIFNYLPLGFTNNWVEIKGGISQGWLLDDRGVKGNTDVLLHEKIAYMRLGNTKIKPYAGLQHSALFGGTKPNGKDIPIDFWATFLASGSAKIGGGEETNAAGAHMGLWDFGAYFNMLDWQGRFYWQKPFADGSGMFLNWGYNKDHIIGIDLKTDKKQLVNGISLEWIKTDWQSGAGIPDPLYPEGHPKEGQIIWLDEIDDYDAFMCDVFGEETTGWGETEVKRYLEDEMNHGNNYGGRDDYMNNGIYYGGWTHHGQSMGTPLFHTADMVRLYAPDWKFKDGVVFINNRVKGVHVGLEGWINQRLSYRCKLTATWNYGSYGEEYHGRYSWEKTENYYFESVKKETYSMVELKWKPFKNRDVSLSGTLAMDFGDLYNSVGGKLGICYTPTIMFKK